MARPKPMSADRKPRLSPAALRDALQERDDYIARVEKLLSECRDARMRQTTRVAWIFLSLGAAAAWLLTMAWYNL